jgi:hypothetical protein
MPGKPKSTANGSRLSVDQTTGVRLLFRLLTDLKSLVACSAVENRQAKRKKLAAPNTTQ